MNDWKTVNSEIDMPGLIEKFASLGFRNYKQDLEGFYTQKMLFSKTLKDVDPVCLINERLCLHIQVTEYRREKFLHQGFQSDISGQSPNGERVKVESWGYQFGELFEQLPTIERRLIVAWKAICAE